MFPGVVGGLAVDAVDAPIMAGTMTAIIPPAPDETPPPMMESPMAIDGTVVPVNVTAPVTVGNSVIVTVGIDALVVAPAPLIGGESTTVCAEIVPAPDEADDPIRVRDVLPALLIPSAPAPLCVGPPVRVGMIVSVGELPTDDDTPPEMTGTTAAMDVPAFDAVRLPMIA